MTKKAEDKLSDITELKWQIDLINYRTPLFDELNEECSEVERCLERYPNDLPMAAKHLLEAVRIYKARVDQYCEAVEAFANNMDKFLES